VHSLGPALTVITVDLKVPAQPAGELDSDSDHAIYVESDADEPEDDDPLTMPITVLEPVIPKTCPMFRCEDPIPQPVPEELRDLFRIKAQREYEYAKLSRRQKEKSKDRGFVTLMDGQICSKITEYQVKEAMVAKFDKSGYPATIQWKRFINRIVSDPWFRTLQDAATGKIPVTDLASFGWVLDVLDGAPLRSLDARDLKKDEGATLAFRKLRVG
jgi:hypothetical protein